MLSQSHVALKRLHCTTSNFLHTASKIEADGYFIDFHLLGSSPSLQSLAWGCRRTVRNVHFIVIDLKDLFGLSLIIKKFGWRFKNKKEDMFKFIYETLEYKKCCFFISVDKGLKAWGVIKLVSITFSFVICYFYITYIYVSVSPY